MDSMNRRLYAFSYRLGYSRFRYTEFTTDLRIHNLVEFHMNCFLYKIGTAVEILYDKFNQAFLT